MIYIKEPGKPWKKHADTYMFKSQEMTILHWLRMTHPTWKCVSLEVIVTPPQPLAPIFPIKPEGA